MYKYVMFALLFFTGADPCISAEDLKTKELSTVNISWAVPDLPYRVIVEVPPCDLGKRSTDIMPASVMLDFTSAIFTSLNLSGPVDLDSIVVLRQDKAAGQVLPFSNWMYQRIDGEIPSRFLDSSIPWDFPSSISGTVIDRPPIFYPRAGYLSNVHGNGKAGLLAWDHTQKGNADSLYAIYFTTRPDGQLQKIPRQGFIGDGSPRRDINASPMTGMFYNNVTIDDWDGDGLTDLIIGTGNGNILFYRNEGSKYRPKFGIGEYICDETGLPLTVGLLATPFIVDWNGDGKKDLLVSFEGGKLVWFENTGSNLKRKYVFRGYVKADGQDIVTPPLPCPEAPYYKQDYAPGIEAIDWDNDGDRDLLLGGWTTGMIFYYENVGKAEDGTPLLTARGPLEADGKPIDTGWAAHPCAVDLDGDGKLDLLTGAQGIGAGGGYKQPTPGLLYYKNIGTHSNPGLTLREITYEGSPFLGTAGQPRAWDFNNDGLVDLVVSECTGVYLLENVGTKKSHKFKVEILKTPWGVAVPVGLIATQLIDWNGDEYFDIIASPQDSKEQPKVFFNLGKGTHGVFSASQPLLPKDQEIIHKEPYGDPWAFVYVCDFDNDGAIDLLWADFTGHAYLHRNLGTSKEPYFDIKGQRLELTSGQPIKVGPPIVPIDQIKDFTTMQGSRASIVAADFNKDGKNDIVMGDALGDVIYFQNVGTNEKPLFATGFKLGRFGQRAKAFPYDWDGDGYHDVVVYTWDGNISWCRNLGLEAKPQFGAPQRLTIPPTIPCCLKSLVIADWNEDGDDDWMLQASYPWFCWLDGSYIKHGYINGRILTVEAWK